MSLSRTVLTDRTGVITTVGGLAVGGLAVGLDHPALVGVLVLRLLIPVLLILHAGRGATPAQRISLVRDYLCLTGTTTASPVPPRPQGRTRHSTTTGSRRSGR